MHRFILLLHNDKEVDWIGKKKKYINDTFIRKNMKRSQFSRLYGNIQLEYFTRTIYLTMTVGIEWR